MAQARKVMSPTVSIMIPVLNEERYLAQVVAASLNQDYQNLKQVILSVGPSHDRTEEIARELAAQDSRVVVVNNPTGRTPDALNCAIAVATGEIVVRCDGHALLPRNYVSLAVETLQRTGADNVGGIMDAQGESAFQKAVAWAMTSKLGVGSAAFHVGGTEGEVETVYLGCFKKSALDRVDGYDPAMTRAQDWEMNHRIRKTGGRIWFNPALKVIYRPRRTVKSLAQQYLQYGQWRRRVMKMHPETTKGLRALRYFAPPLAVLATLLGIFSGIVGLIVGGLWILGFLVPLLYIAAVKFIGLFVARNVDLKTRLLIPIALTTMHMAWGWGFLTSPHA
jgi:glycosyltransferase involved in cell wall biosynthesis